MTKVLIWDRYRSDYNMLISIDLRETMGPDIFRAE
jgi:hypothetical protein